MSKGNTPKRIYNFNPGPAMLPLEVLEAVKESLINYDGTGMGILEISHRGSAFQAIIHETEANLRALLDINVGHTVLFATGGATNQFSMVPMNLLKQGSVADYILSGHWAERALDEAKKFGQTNVAASSRDAQYRYIPTEVRLSENSSYCHFTSNNTIYGTQFTTEPEVQNVPLVCDASSDFLHKKIDISKYALIYAGAQKNLGPAGVTIVVIRGDMLGRSPHDLPIMMNYNTYAESGSLYNTPPVFAIYVMGEVLKWIKRSGGLKAIEERNRAKAALLYQAIDSSEFYAGYADPDSRSLMNVTFRLRREDLEPRFASEAAAAGLVGLKGHRAIGGLRASIYNAFPVEGVERLVQFMADFEKKYA